MSVVASPHPHDFTQRIQETTSCLLQYAELPPENVGIVVDFLVKRSVADTFKLLKQVSDFAGATTPAGEAWKQTVHKCVSATDKIGALVTARSDLDALVGERIHTDTLLISAVRLRSAEVTISPLYLMGNRPAPFTCSSFHPSSDWGMQQYEKHLGAALDPVVVKEQGARFYLFHNRTIFHVTIASVDQYRFTILPLSDGNLIWDLSPARLKEILAPELSNQILVASYGSNTQLLSSPTLEEETTGNDAS